MLMSAGVQSRTISTGGYHSSLVAPSTPLTGEANVLSMIDFRPCFFASAVGLCGGLGVWCFVVFDFARQEGSIHECWRCMHGTDPAWLWWNADLGGRCVNCSANIPWPSLQPRGLARGSMQAPYSACPLRHPPRTEGRSVHEHIGLVMVSTCQWVGHMQGEMMSVNLKTEAPATITSEC